MENKNQIILGALILIIASAIFFYTNENRPQIQGEVIQVEEILPVIETPEPEGPTPEPIPEPAQETKEFVVTAKRFEFTPSPIIVNQGDQVKLIVTSTDVTHGIAIGEYSINERLNPGETKIIEFTADKKGEFSMFCNVPCGSGHGSMRGKLIVN